MRYLGVVQVDNAQEFIALPKLPAKMRQAQDAGMNFVSKQGNFPTCFDISERTKKFTWVADTDLEIVSNVCKCCNQPLVLATHAVGNPGGATVFDTPTSI